MRDSVWKLLTILAIAVAAGLVVAFVPFRLGLDLQGGVHVLMEAEDTADVKVDNTIMQQVLAVVDKRVNGLGVSEPVIERVGDRRVVVELPGIKDQKAAIDAIGKTAQLKIEAPDGSAGLTGTDLKHAQATTDQFGRPAVSLEFSNDGAKKLRDFTIKYQGQQTPYVLDDNVLVNPVVQEPIMDGKAIITGNFTSDEAKNLAVLLNSGALPVPLHIMEIRNVGPILGQESIDRSINAGILAGVLIIAFMFVWYRLPGGLADVALFIYAGILMALLLMVHATLTLPGLAGFILSLGMAVDANVLIFERIKDEIRRGKRLRPAVDAGFKRAWSAILDGHVTTALS
ncbi:MAG TPA: protein translocase subunit SecD, partial [Limnochordia bacterium]|nr:protein translocase subunit SecD [Limnochordia bacterium]